MFHLMFSLPGLYVIARFLWPSSFELRSKLVAAMLVLLASQYHLYSRWSSGSVFSPEMPRPMVIALDWAFCLVLLIALLQLADDLIALLPRLLSIGPKRLPSIVRQGIAVVALCLATFGVSQALRVPPLVDIEVDIAGLPPEFAGYRLLQLTDLHISRLFDERWTRDVVQASNALGVDAILVTGDLIDGSIAERERDIEPLRALKAPDGVFVIPGNHEYFFGEEAWMRYFEGLGMRPLPNSHAVLTRGGASLVVAGLTDLTAPLTGAPAPDLEQALKGAPPKAPVVLMDHQPRNARVAASRGVALQLSGHTHGGLVVGLDRLFAKANGGFVSGRYDVNGMTLYVNNGTALWPGLALRLGKPSELTRITLRRKPG